MMIVSWIVSSVLLAVNQCQDDSVQCWDNCLPLSSLSTLYKAGRTRRHGFTSVFDKREKPRSVLETIICGLLDQVGDSSDYVEYWWRDSCPPRFLAAHRDIDEVYSKRHQVPMALGSELKVGKQTCPLFGHVLYVQVDESVRAPTLVWQENEQGGGGPPRLPLTKICSVPAVSNRLLRFRGDCLHAVGYPPLSFLNETSTRGDKRVANDPNQQPGRRAVLLFNTWKKPPLYPKVGRDLSQAETDIVSSLSSQDAVAVCNSRSQWEKTKIVRHSSKTENEIAKLSVPLLGDASRRACLDDSLDSWLEKKAAVEALTSANHIHLVDFQS